MSLDINSPEKSLDTFISEYQNKVSNQNATAVIKDFQQDWLQIISYTNDPKEEDLDIKYGKALLIYSAAVYQLDKISDRDVNVMSKYIEDFDKSDVTKYRFFLKSPLYRNLGLCWNRLDKDKEAVTAFKRHLYYLLLQSTHTSYSPIAYKYRPYTKYLIESLKDETIGLTSPTTFNDPFDCPIIELLNNDEKVSGLIRQAYNDCLKIACFSANTKLPYDDDNKQKLVQEEKQCGSMPEYCNELMWAHYADSHKGVCIKYHFPNSLTQLADGKDGVMCYFKDVSYSSQDLHQYSGKDSINLYDAFFLKGEKWMYENELRLLYFDINGRPGFHSISAKNYIEAVYFGLKCPQKHRDKIREILKDRIHEKEDLRGNKTQHVIEFYEMVIDKQHFGQVTARKIAPQGSDILSTRKRICLLIRRFLGCIVKCI
jgi:hypothetical protein